MDRLLAQAVEMLLGDRAVLPLLRRHGGIRVADRLQCALHLHPADTDFGNAVAFAQPGDRLAQRTIEHLALAVIQRAVLKDGVELEPRHIDVRHRRCQRLVLRPVAAGLHDQHGLAVPARCRT